MSDVGLQMGVVLDYQMYRRGGGSMYRCTDRGGVRIPDVQMVEVLEYPMNKQGRCLSFDFERL